MDFNDVWLKPTKQFEDGEKEGQYVPGSSKSVCFPPGYHPLKKIQLVPLANELVTSSLPELERISPVPPVTDIKPPPTIFTDLWGESDDSFSEPDEVPQVNILDSDQIEGQPYLPVSTDPLLVFGGTSQTIVSSKAEDTLDGLWEIENSASDETNEDVTESALAFSGMLNFENLDLFDVDAVLAKQEAEIQQHSYDPERERVPRENRFERWGGALSLIHVNWDDPETAERDALARLGYTNVTLSEETRAFIIQAARNARLPHKQEVQLTTQLAEARARLASLPPAKEDAVDSYAAKRQALQAEITEIEQMLTIKMQWVAIKKAVQFLGRGIELDDLIQFGMEGVIAGIRHFDITRKARLLLVVNTWVFQAITRAIADHGSAVRLPAHMFELVHTLEKLHLQWQREHGRLPTRQELAEAMNVSLKDLSNVLRAREMLKSLRESLSIEYLASAEHFNEGYSFQELEASLIASDDEVANVLGKIRVQQTQQILFRYLSSREIEVLSLRAGLDGDGEEHTLEAIGKRLKITRERVRQIEERAKKKLLFQVRRTFPELLALQKAAKVIPHGSNKHRDKGGSEKFARVTPEGRTLKANHSPHQERGRGEESVPYAGAVIAQYLEERRAKKAKNAGLK